METISQKIYCAFCRLGRRTYTKKSITWTNVVASVLTSFLIMFVIWQQLNPRVIVIFVIFLAASEVFVRLRWRMGLVCPHCGFDPLVYKRDKNEAAQRVKVHLEKLRSSGRHFLKSRNPLASIPVRKVKTDTASRNLSAKQQGHRKEAHFISKSV